MISPAIVFQYRSDWSLLLDTPCRPIYIFIWVVFTHSQVMFIYNNHAAVKILAYDVLVFPKQLR